MASGSKSYFRHSFEARKDPKIVEMIVKHGKETYFHFFALCEMCGKIAVDEGFPKDKKFKFHKRTLCDELMVTPQRLTHHLGAIKSSLLGDYMETGSTVEIKLHNLKKYLGQYEKKKLKNALIKENKSKLNKKKSGFSDSLNPVVIGAEIQSLLRTHSLSTDITQFASEGAKIVLGKYSRTLLGNSTQFELNALVREALKVGA